MDKFKDIGILGPLSNRVCGWSMFNETNAVKGKIDFFKVPYISFFFVLLRKEAIRSLGIFRSKLLISIL